MVLPKEVVKLFKKGEPQALSERTIKKHVLSYFTTANFLDMVTLNHVDVDRCGFINYVSCLLPKNTYWLYIFYVLAFCFPLLLLIVAD